MINNLIKSKRVYLVGIYGRTSFRVRFADVLRILPDLFATGKVRDIISYDRWRDYRSKGLYEIRLFMAGWEVEKLIRENNIKVLKYNEEDYSVSFLGEHSVGKEIDIPKNVIYI